MASFQETLKESSVPGIGGSSGVTQAPKPVDQTAAIAFKGLTNIVKLAFDAFEESEKRDLLEGEKEDIRFGLTTAANRVEELNQGKISLETFQYKKTQDRILVARRGEKALDAYDNFYGEPFLTGIADDDAAAVERGRLEVPSNATLEEAREAGYKAIISDNALNAAVKELELAEKTGKANETVLERGAVNVANAISNKFSPFIDQATTLITSTKSGPDYIKLVKEIIPTIQGLQIQAEQALTRGLPKNISLKAKEDAIKHLDLGFRAVKKLIDTEEGPVSAAASLGLLKMLTAQAGLSAAVAAPTILSIRQTVGEAGLPVLLQHLTMGDVTFTEVMKTELSAALRQADPGLTQTKIDKALSIVEFINLNRDPDDPKKVYGDDADKRMSAVNVALGLTKGAKLEPNSSKQDIRTFTAQVALALNIGIDHTAIAENRGKILKIHSDTTFENNLKQLDKLNSEASALIRRTVSRFSADTLRKYFRDNDEFVYNAEKGEVVFEAVVTPRGEEAEQTELEGVGVTPAPKLEANEEQAKQIALMNIALKNFDTHASVDKALKNMSSIERKEMVISALESLVGRKILSRKSDWMSNVGKKAPEAQDAIKKRGLQRTDRENKADREKDRVLTLFESALPKFKEGAEVLRRSLRGDYSVDDKGQVKENKADDLL